MGQAAENAGFTLVTLDDGVLAPQSDAGPIGRIGGMERAAFVAASTSVLGIGDVNQMKANIVSATPTAWLGNGETTFIFGGDGGCSRPASETADIPRRRASVRRPIMRLPVRA